MYIKTGEIDTYIKIIGNRRLGDIVALHGWGCSSDTMLPLCRPLCSDYRIIIPDLPGFGKTAAPINSWSAADYANHIHMLLKALDIENPIMLGHSNGGRIILKMCATGIVNPKKIVLLGSAGVKTPKPITVHLKILVYKFMKTLKNNTPLKRSAKFNKFIGCRFGSGDYKAAAPVMKATMSRLLKEDLSPVLHKVSANTLLIFGENDTAAPLKQARKMNRLIKNSGLCVIKKAGHFCFLDRPAEVNAILQSFLL